MDLTLFKNITINGQAVVQLSLDGSVVWKKDGEEDEVKQYFNIEALEDGTIEMKHSGTNATTTMPVLEYSTDKINWNNWDYSPISVNTGNKIYFRGINDYFSKNVSNYSTLSTTFSFNANGNIMSLLYGDDFNGQVSLSGKDYCFYKLFYQSKIVKAPVLPATTLSNSCYGNMFSSCSKLTTAPELPATTLAKYCYSNMFMFCSNLTIAPELPATTLAPSCYNNMFYNCSNLTIAPELPATTLAPSCYSGMFGSCSKLTTAPELPATTLASSCYNNMFNYCNKLTTIKCNARYNSDGTEITSKIDSNWLNKVSSTGTFYKNTEWSGPTERGVNTIPTGWTIVDWTDAG